MGQVCFVLSQLGQRCLPKVVPEPPHTFCKCHSHELAPGGTTADRVAEMDQRQFPLPEGPYRAPS